MTAKYSDKYSAKYSDSIESSSLFSGNSAYIIELYESYLADENSVSDYWQQYFKNNYAQLQQEQSEKLTREKFYSFAQNKARVMQAAGPAAAFQGGVCPTITFAKANRESKKGEDFAAAVMEGDVKETKRCSIFDDGTWTINPALQHRGNQHERDVLKALHYMTSQQPPAAAMGGLIPLGFSSTTRTVVSSSILS